MPRAVSLAVMITQLEGLLGMRRLSDWEETFVSDVARRTKMERQMGAQLSIAGGTPDKVMQIWEKHFA